MRNLVLWLTLMVIISCKKYKDPSPFTDSRINNPYCNEPAALNYNWGFPGIADNSLCIYPSTFFSGNYFYHDTIYDVSGNVLGQDSFMIAITALDTAKVNISGFCGSNILKATADKYYKLRLDSTFSAGQHVCSTTDTINGEGSKKGFSDTATIKLSYQIHDVSGTSYHAGTAIKQ